MTPKRIIQRRLHVIGDLLCEHVWFRQVVGFLQALVLEPENVQIHVVPLQQFLLFEYGPDLQREGQASDYQRHRRRPLFEVAAHIEPRC